MTYRCPNNLNLSLLFLRSAWPMRRAPLACGDQGLEIHSTRTVPGLTVMLTASPPHPSTCSAKPWVTSTPSSATAVGKRSCWFSRPATWHLTVQQQENRHSNSLTPTGICQKSMFLGVEDPANTHNADSEEAYVFPWGVRTSIWDLAACPDHPGFTMLLPNYHFSAERITTLVLQKNEERREVETGMTVYYWTRGCRLCLRAWMWGSGRSPAQPPTKSWATLEQIPRVFVQLGLPSSQGWSQHSCFGQPLPMLDCTLNNNVSWNN